MVTNKKGEKMTPEHYGDIFTKEFSIPELDRYLTKIKKNTAPGKSGIRARSRGLWDSLVPNSKL